MSYRSSLQALKQSGDSPNGEYCGEALLLSLLSTATDSANSIPRIFSCLWGEIGKISQSFSTIYMEDFLYIYIIHIPPPVTTFQSHHGLKILAKEVNFLISNFT
jgi:hypothetical protein